MNFLQMSRTTISNAKCAINTRLKRFFLSNNLINTKLTKFETNLSSEPSTDRTVRLNPSPSSVAKFTTLDLNNNVVFYILNSNAYYTNYNFNFFYFLQNSFKLAFIYFLDVFKRTIGDGFIYLRGLFIIFFIDACLTDDEPI